MRVLIACEESQVICKAFRDKGHKAYSCDIQDCSGGFPKWHIKGDVLKYINDGWDMMIGHPPCTYLSYAAMHVWNNPGRLEKRLEALDFFAKLWLAPIEKICLENPKGCASPTIAKYSQEIQPYYFGDNHIKTTWLWLKNLPMLQHFRNPTLFGDEVTHINKPEAILVQERKPSKYYKGGEKKKRYFSDAKSSLGSIGRSKTFYGIAQAMAEQWG